MKNELKLRVIAILLAGALAACSTPPKLNQVGSSATERPINTPEVAAALKQQYEK